jgi:hypothetical protein
MIQILSGISADFVVASNHLPDLFDGEPVDTEAPAAVTTGGLTEPRMPPTEPRTSVSGLKRRSARA